MRVSLQTTWMVSAVLALGAGCSSRHVAVEAKSGGLATYQSSQGGVNTPGFALGDVVAVDPRTHKAWKVASVSVEATEVAITPTGGQASEPFASKFDLDYSQKVSNTMQASVDETVRGQTVLHVENYFTRAIKKPELFVAGSGQLARAVQKASSQNPDAKFFVVSAVTSADKLFLSFDGAEGDVAKFGQYQFHISYPQNQELEKLAEDSTAFFKVTPLKLESVDGRTVVAVDQESGEKLPDYKFERAVASSN